MPNITLENFARIVHRRGDGRIRVDINTGKLKASRDNRFNRAIRWFRSRLSRAPSELATRKAADSSAHNAFHSAQDIDKAEGSSAHNAFLRAIANDFYSAQDIAEVRKKLEVNHFLGKDLSSRLVREIISDLKNKDSASRRDVIMTAYHLSEMKASGGETIGNYLSRSIGAMVSERPRLRDADYRMEPERKAALSQRIFDSVTEMNSGDSKVKNLPQIMRQGQSIADKLISEVLDEEEQRLFPPEEQRPLQAETGQQEIRSPEGQLQDFSHLLKEKNIPDGAALQKQLQKASQTIGSDVAGIKFVNQHTRQWIEENRLHTWYHEAFPEQSKTAPIPQQLQEQVRQSLAEHKTMMSYNQAKAQTRAIVKNYVETNYAGSLSGQLASANLPDSVSQQLAALIKSGDVTDKASLAKRGNVLLAEWVNANRVGKWYRQGLENEGVKFEGAQLIPEKLLEDVTDAVKGRAQLWPYELLKDHVRQIANEHAREYAEEAIYGTRV